MVFGALEWLLLCMDPPARPARKKRAPVRTSPLWTMSWSYRGSFLGTDQVCRGNMRTMYGLHYEGVALGVPSGLGGYC